MEAVTKKRQFNPDRVALDSATLSNLKMYAAQIADAFGGLIRLSNKELVNFILLQRANALSEIELSTLKNEFFDDVRAAQWALKKLKDAKSSGETLSLGDVLKIVQTPQVKRKRLPKAPKAPRSVASAKPDAHSSSNADIEPQAPRKTPATEDVK
jgi:hypothetical protein